MEWHSTHRLNGEDTSLSRWVSGFESRWVRQNFGKLAELVNAPDCKSGALVASVVRIHYFPPICAGIAQQAERWCSTPEVIGSKPISRSIIFYDYADVTQQVECRIENPVATGSIPVVCTITWGFSSDGRAPALQAGGHRFEPDNLHHISLFREAIMKRKPTARKSDKTRKTEGV